MTHLNTIIFVLAFLCVTFWLQAKLFLSSLGTTKKPEVTLKDQKILSMVRSKTNYQLKAIYLTDSKKLFGMMPSFIKPHLILSQALYDNFDEDETEYVLLHEMAHFLLHHVLTETILGLFLLIIGITGVIYFDFSLLPALFIGLILGVIMIRFGRLHEYEADSYSLTHMTDPQGMIGATIKFQKHYKTPGYLFEFLFYRGNPFSNRIRMGKEEISRRKNTL